MKFLIILFLLFLFASCYHVERDCKNYKNGTFQSTIRIDGKDYISTFIRNDSLQIETFGNKTDSASV
ncbi:MAG: DNA topoisomerase IV, partial [Bacteroidia bacterium]|nr:DNA topoisomerase IV [Bacteroidia bacterium]